MYFRGHKERDAGICNRIVGASKIRPSFIPENINSSPYATISLVSCVAEGLMGAAGERYRQTVRLRLVKNSLAMERAESGRLHCQR